MTFTHHMGQSLLFSPLFCLFCLLFCLASYIHVLFITITSIRSATQTPKARRPTSLRIACAHMLGLGGGYMSNSRCRLQLAVRTGELGQCRSAVCLQKGHRTKLGTQSQRMIWETRGQLASPVQYSRQKAFNPSCYKDTVILQALQHQGVVHTIKAFQLDNLHCMHCSRLNIDSPMVPWILVATDP